MNQQVKYIVRTCDLAMAALGATRTNPLVGALIVAGNRILAEGWHRYFGGPHAEVEAFRSVPSAHRKKLMQSTLYVSLEPCSHQGKTGACTVEIISQGVPHIVVAERDPNPQVKGIEILRDANRKVNVKSIPYSKQVLRPFFIQQCHHRPYIILKWAESRDGFMGKSNQRLQISNHASKRLVHRWRSQVDAIMVGSGTVLCDDPLLTTRYHFGTSPLRIVLDRRGILKPSMRVFTAGADTRVYCEQVRKDLGKHIEQVTIPFDSEVLSGIMSDLYDDQIGSVLVEGGQRILSAMLSEGLWDECRIIRSSSDLKSGLEAPRIPGPIMRSIVLQDNQIDIVYRDSHPSQEKSR